MKSTRPLREPRRVALPVEMLAKVLHPLLQGGDALLLRSHAVRLLLHGGVEQKDTDDTDGENEYDARGERNLATVRECRTRAHKCTMRGNVRNVM